MKKIISAVTCLALAFSLTVASVSAEEAPATVNFESRVYTLGENNKMAFRETTYSAFAASSDASCKSIDVISNYKTSADAADNWISTSYNESGFRVAKSSDGLTVTPSAKSVLNGNYIQVSFTAKAEAAVENGMIGIYYDVEINNNDAAQLNVIKENNKAIGFDMTDVGTTTLPKLSVYLRGKPGVTDVDTYWFGGYEDDTKKQFKSMETDDPATLYPTDYDQYYIKDTDGKLIGYKSNDSSMNFAWRNINLAAGESKTFSVIIGVGNAQSQAPVISSVEKTDAGYVVKGTQAGSYEKTNFAVMYKLAENDTATSPSAISWDGDNFTTTVPVDTSAYTTPGDYNISFLAMNNYGASSNTINKTFNVAAPVVPDPETPVVPDPETPVVPDPEAPVVPAPEAPVVPAPAAPVVDIKDPETPLAPAPVTPAPEAPKAENPKTNSDAISISLIAAVITMCGGLVIISRRKKESK